jgi:hypothetical protein
MTGVTRRRLLAGSAALLVGGAAWTKSAAAVDVAALTLLARDLFPHTIIADATYRGIVETLLASPPQRQAAEAALRTLDGAAPGSWSRLAPAERVAGIETLLSTPRGQALRAAVLIGLYGDLSVTRRFGYQGPSIADGGYIERGFNDLDWLPEPPRGDARDG